jgi:threonine-phosphate decarboxylase
MLIGHGDDAPQSLAANFSSNVWYGANNTLLYAHITDHLRDTRRYPEALPDRLTNSVAAYHNLTDENVLITNGATEAIYLVAQTFSKYRTAIIIPSFSEYEDACNLHEHKLTFIDEAEITAHTVFTEQLVFIGNPNNPSGKAYTKTFVETLLHNNPNTIFVIDEAYADFTIVDNSAVNCIGKFENLIIIRSLTKTFCIPGLRLGYIIASNAHINKIMKYKMPWSVNVVAIRAGEFIFNAIEKYQIPLKDWLNETLRISNKIKKLDNFNVYTSDTTYLLCQTLKSTASSLKQYLLQKHDILIRDASNFRGLTPSHFRVCTQTHAQNELLIDALKEWNLSF